MDRDPSRSNVWPYRQYDGGDRYEEYVVDKDTWIIEKGYKKHLSVPATAGALHDPRKCSVRKTASFPRATT